MKRISMKSDREFKDTLERIERIEALLRATIANNQWMRDCRNCRATLTKRHGLSGR